MVNFDLQYRTNHSTRGYDLVLSVSRLTCEKDTMGNYGLFANVV